MKAHPHTAHSPFKRIAARFDRLTEVASGSMGTVYKAWDSGTARFVALKLLDQPSTADRFEREAVLLSQIHHPNLVRYVAHGVARDGQPWLAMEWLDGEDLATRLKRGPLSVRETLDLAIAVAEGLACAHACGLVHRDLKPANLFLPAGLVARAKVLDFGLARAVADEEAITRTGVLMGTLHYIAPEQATDAKRVDARADVFSLGAVLYECLTGSSPFEGDTLDEILARVLCREVAPVGMARAGVPTPFEELIAAMLMKDPIKRPNSGLELASILAEIEMQFRSTTLRVVDESYASTTRLLAARPQLAAGPAPPPPPSSEHTLVMQSPSVRPPPPSRPPPSRPLPSRPPPSRSRFAIGVLAVVLIIAGLGFGVGVAFHVATHGPPAAPWWLTRTSSPDPASSLPSLPTLHTRYPAPSERTS